MIQIEKDGNKTNVSFVVPRTVAIVLALFAFFCVAVIVYFQLT